ncbi:MAG: helix-turn-helix domain-containing protein [Candidatus Aminicenantes bacterium]|nr:helix-turn-helix domain-containing protein [Candidatus Aminicenantes bacterium]
MSSEDDQDKKKYEIDLGPKIAKVDSQEKKLFDKFEDVIEKHMSDKITIDMLCEHLIMGKSDLKRKIKTLTGKPPLEFIRIYRMKRAAQLLKDNYGNVGEVAEAVGYPDQFHFSKRFKEIIGVPPKKYQLSFQQGDRSSETSIPLLHQPASLAYELDRELIFRRALEEIDPLFQFDDKDGTPLRHGIFEQVKKIYESGKLFSILNEARQYLTDSELIQKFRQWIDERKTEVTRSSGYTDIYMDVCALIEDRIRRNSLAITVACLKKDLLPRDDNFHTLRAKTYGPTFNLCADERFYHQPIAAGPICTGILVGEDVMLTTAHFANEDNVSNLRFIFDFVMLDSVSPLEKIPSGNVYKGTEIIHRVHNPEGDWALVKLDRKVVGRETASVSQKGIFYEQPVYVMSHPCGLPLKFSPGSFVEAFNESYFRAPLDVYSGSSGAPVFCAETHELIGIVSRFRPDDFRWTGSCWITLPYRKSGESTRCTRVTQFREYL